MQNLESQCRDLIAAGEKATVADKSARFRHPFRMTQAMYDFACVCEDSAPAIAQACLDQQAENGKLKAENAAQAKRIAELEAVDHRKTAIERGECPVCGAHEEYWRTLEAKP